MKNKVILISVFIFFMMGLGSYFFVLKENTNEYGRMKAIKEQMQQKQYEKVALEKRLNESRMKKAELQQKKAKDKVAPSPLNSKDTNPNEAAPDAPDFTNTTNGTEKKLGSLSREKIQKVFKNGEASIKYCYERELYRNPKLEGKIIAILLINSNGKVENIKIDKTSLQNKRLHKCIKDKIKRWIFPKPKGGIVKIKYPFIFKTSN